jgi:polyhydroxyalkanoate synthesis regulator phasin
MTMIATLEMVKKAFLVGLGATVLTAEKVKELIDELVERGEINQQEAKGFAEDLKTRAVKEREQFEHQVKEQVDSTLKKTLDSLGLVTKKDLDALRDEIRSHDH